jgi:tetratricopeptide (TPR) repeat protein
MRAFSQAAQDPQVFRRLDREERFDTVWLLGDPSGFKPLVEHLLETKDFGLVWLDHTSLIFRRSDGARWNPGELDALRDQFRSRTDRAQFLADAATKLVAAHEMEAAGSRLSEAEKMDDRVAAVWSGWATYELARGELSAAGAAADRALSLDRSFLPAMACKTQVLFGTKRFTEAFRMSKELLRRAPDDPGLLFYHAKLAHQAQAFDAEISTLRHLIKLGQAAGASVSGYRVYLGQAHAAKGDADEALDQLSLALLDTELPREQRLFADQLFLQIKDRVGLPGDPKK